MIYGGSDSLVTVRASGGSFRKETNGNRNPFTLRSVSESKRKQSKYTHTRIRRYKHRRFIETVLTELFIKILLLKKEENYTESIYVIHRDNRNYQ